jgi:hypothetical protein
MTNGTLNQSGGVNLTGNIGRDAAGRDIVYNIQGVDPAVLKNLEERLNEFLGRFVILRLRLEEWKELHNILQDLQIQFAICRGYTLELGRRDSPEEPSVFRFLSKPSARQTEMINKYLYEFSINWQPCKRTLDKLRWITLDLRQIVNDFPAGNPSRPDLSLAALERLQREMDEALHDEDRYNLTDLIGAFAKQVDDGLYVTDKALRGVAQEINQLPQQIKLLAYS